MTDKQSAIEIAWTGPFAWPSFELENNLPPIPDKPGVYLQTFEYKDGYLIYIAGITRRSVPGRFSEHTIKYMKGDYTVLDIEAIKKGVRKEVWHGWGYARKHRQEFEERKSIILQAAKKQLSAFRIFIADMGGVKDEQRLFERLEASIMQNLYQQSSPFCDIPDKGMQLAPRWDSESPIIIKNKCAKLIHRLPAIITI